MHRDVVHAVDLCVHVILLMCDLFAAALMDMCTPCTHTHTPVIVPVKVSYTYHVLLQFVPSLSLINYALSLYLHIRMHTLIHALNCTCTNTRTRSYILSTHIGAYIHVCVTQARTSMHQPPMTKSVICHSLLGRCGGLHMNFLSEAPYPGSLVSVCL